MRQVIITTGHRGVFFGALDDAADETARSIVLHGARNAIYWTQETGGFLGLASHGPGNGSRIGRTAPRVLLHDVTSVASCSEDAAKKWREWPEGT